MSTEQVLPHRIHLDMTRPSGQTTTLVWGSAKPIDHPLKAWRRAVEWVMLRRAYGMLEVGEKVTIRVREHPEWGEETFG